MNKLRVIKLWPIMAVLSFLLILSSCKKDDEPEPTAAQLLLGAWRCEITSGTDSGDWDELNFTSPTNLTWRFYSASSGSTIKFEYTYVTTESTIFLTYKDDNSKSAHSYTINGDELTFEDGDYTYLYKKKH